MMGWLGSFIKKFTIFGSFLRREKSTYHLYDSKHNEDRSIPISLGQCELMIEDTFKEQNHINGCENCLKLAQALNACVYNLRSNSFTTLNNLMQEFERQSIEDHIKQANVGYRTQELMDTMRVAMIVVGLGRAVRNDIAIKMKQPLSELYIQAASKKMKEAILNQKETIKEFLNVRDIRFVEGLSRIVILPNTVILGKKLNKRLKILQEYLKELDSKEIEHLSERIKVNLGVDLELSDGKLSLESGELLLSSSAQKGIREEDGIAVSFNPEINEELKGEYIIRELSREINLFRKEQNCTLTEIVTIQIEGPDEIVEAVYKHWEVLQAKVKCRLVTAEELPIRKNILIGDEEVQIQMEKSE